MSNEYPAGYTPMTGNDFWAIYMEVRRAVIANEPGVEEYPYETAIERAVIARLPKPDALQTAAINIYMAGKWECKTLPDDVQIALWEALRDATGLAPGTATNAGIHKTQDTAERDVLAQKYYDLLAYITVKPFGADTAEREALVRRIDEWLGYEEYMDVDELLSDIRAHLVGGVE